MQASSNARMLARYNAWANRGFVAQMMYDIPVRPSTTDLTVYL